MVDTTAPVGHGHWPEHGRQHAAADRYGVRPDRHGRSHRQRLTYTATNNGDGTWTLADNSIAPALADGTYDVSVSATDAVGNVGSDASVDELVVDTTAPVVTVNGLSTADNTPQLTGTVSDPTATVEVTVNGATYTATNNGDGTWTLADNSDRAGVGRRHL